MNLNFLLLRIDFELFYPILIDSKQKLPKIVRLSMKIALISYWNDYSLIPSTKYAC